MALTDEDGNKITCCDLDITNNIWVEGVVDVAAGKRGICMLDTMSREQIIHVLQHNPWAKDDLLRVTTNQTLIDLANSVKILDPRNQADVKTRQSARQGLPYYNVFKGNPPNAQTSKK